MADYERSVLEHYQLPTAYPDEWPADKDLSDASEDEKDEDDRRNNQMNRRKSRYAALDRADSRRSLVPRAENNGDGIENLVQKDEPDPLGTTDSVVRALRSKGLPVQDDVRLSECQVKSLHHTTADLGQETASSCHLPLSPPLCFCPKFTRTLLLSLFYRDSTCSPGLLIRSLHHSRF